MFAFAKLKGEINKFQCKTQKRRLGDFSLAESEGLVRDLLLSLSQRSMK